MSNKRKPAVFLDRDGVLTKEKSYICKVEEMEIFSYTADCIRKIKEKGYYAIVITNQSGVARGYLTETELWKMNEYLVKKTEVDAIYYCPHHPEGLVAQYRRECNCRKPKTGMLEQACSDFCIELAHSYMIGDRACDILTGQRFGISTVLLESGYGTKHMEEKITPDYLFTDLRNVLEIL